MSAVLDPAAVPASVSRTASRRRVNVLGCWIDDVDMDQAVRIADEAVVSRRPVQHATINAYKLVSMRSDPELKKVIQECELVAADSRPIVWASRLLGDPLPPHVGGIELMHELFALAEQNGYRVYILGATQEVLDTALQRLAFLHPRLTLAGSHHGYFDPSEDRRVAAEIAAATPDILFVAISSPRKEQFLGDHRATLNVPFMMGVGGSIDILAGVTQRAPWWMNRLGLEWLFRLLQEPRRLFRRYAVTNTLFVLILVRTLLLKAVVGRLSGKREAA